FCGGGQRRREDTGQSEISAQGGGESASRPREPRHHRIVDPHSIANSQVQQTAMRIWGYWATLGWAFLAFVASQLLALAILVALRISDLDTLVNAPFDGRLVTIFIVTANPIMIAIIVLAVLGARAPLADYLALVMPPRRDVGIGLVCLVGLIAISDALLYFGGYPLVTPFQMQSYASAAAQGGLAALWLSTVIIPPPRPD